MLILLELGCLFASGELFYRFPTFHMNKELSFSGLVAYFVSI